MTLARMVRGSLRLLGPDETAANRLHDVYQATGTTWMADVPPEHTDGSYLARDGRVMEVLSEHTLQGWLEGYLLSGRHGFFSSYEALIHVIDSTFNQHAKWLEKSLEIPWRAQVSALNILVTSPVWRQDHNGFIHQDPRFSDLVTNKSPRLTLIDLLPDANCLLSVANYCLGSLRSSSSLTRKSNCSISPWTRLPCTAPWGSASGTGRVPASEQ